MKISKEKLLTNIKVMCSMLNLSEEVYLKAKDIVDGMSTNDELEAPFLSRSETIGIIYTSCILEKEAKSQKEIAWLCNVSQLSVNHAYKWVVKNMKNKVEK